MTGLIVALAVGAILCSAPSFSPRRVDPSAYKLEKVEEKKD